QEGKIAKLLDLTEDVIHFAAGATKLVIVYSATKTVQIWDLKTGKAERSAPLPKSFMGNAIHEVVMGSASAGPLFAYIAPEKRTLEMDLASLQTVEVGWRNWSPTNAYGPLHMRASPDGTLLVGWGGGWAGLDMAIFQEGRQQGSVDKFAFSGGAFALP